MSSLAAAVVFQLAASIAAQRHSPGAHYIFRKGNVGVWGCVGEGGWGVSVRPYRFWNTPFFLGCGEEIRRKAQKEELMRLKSPPASVHWCWFYYLPVSGGIDLNPVVLPCSAHGSGSWATLNDTMKFKELMLGFNTKGAFFVRAVFSGDGTNSTFSQY